MAAVDLNFRFSCRKAKCVILTMAMLVSAFISVASADSIFDWFGWTGTKAKEDVSEKSSGLGSFLGWVHGMAQFLENREIEHPEPKSVLQQWSEMVWGFLSFLGYSLKTFISFILSSAQLAVSYALAGLKYGSLSIVGGMSLRLFYILIVLVVLAITVFTWSVWYSRNRTLRQRLCGVVSCVQFTRGRSQSPRSKSTYRHLWLVRGMLWIMLSLAVLSIPWEFIRLYQREQAKKAAVLHAGLPPDCDPQKLTLWQTIKAGLLWHLSWTDHNPCEKYYQAVLVDPLWEVNPVMVLSSALARCVLHPLELFSSSLGRSLKLFFSQIPSQWQPVIMVVILLLFLSILLMTCKYRIRLPLLFVFEPRTPNNNHVRSRRHYISKAPSQSRFLQEESQPTSDPPSRKSRNRRHQNN